jgi:hypothetical protein
MRGHIRKRGRNSWGIVLYLGRDAVTGKDKHKWHAVKGTKKDAQRELVRLLHQLQGGTYSEPSRETVGAFLRRWLRDRVQTSVSSTTYREYVGTVDRYLIPHLGHVRLDRVRPDMIQGVLTTLQTTRGAGQHPLSPATVIKTRAVLSQAFAWAEKTGLLPRNLVLSTDPPRGGAGGDARVDARGRAPIPGCRAGQPPLRLLRARVGYRSAPVGIARVEVGRC